MVEWYKAMISKHISIAIRAGFSVKQAYALGFIDVIQDDGEKELWTAELYDEVKIYLDECDRWDNFKNLDGVKIIENVKKHYEKKTQKSIKLANSLLEHLQQDDKELRQYYGTLLNDRLLVKSLMDHLEKWDQQKHRDHLNKISPSRPNKDKIKELIEDIHTQYNIKNLKPNTDSFLKTI